ncbi:MAG: lactonase family protein [Chloroflexi bacterium]|nr:lactonase family protein [Chloroflexota bacterium]
MTNSLVYIANAGDAPYGITVAELNYQDGTLLPVQHVTEISECHYLNLHPNGKFLVATTMDDDVRVLSFAIDPDTGHLRVINSQLAAGTSPAYVVVDDSGKNVLMVNYIVGETRGNVRVYPIDSDGVIGANTEMIEHDGNSVNPERQEVSHPHMIVTTPDNRFAVVPDLGTDKVYLYALDTARGKLSLSQTLDLPAGAGPRHVAFHPSLPLMYVINELDSTLATFIYDEDDNWRARPILTTLPDGYQQPSARPNTTADVHVHPNGKFLYGSNRGHDSIVIYSLDAEGMPRYLANESTRGAWPRAFMIDPRGEYLVVGNRHTDNAAVFSIDAANGMLTFRSSLALSAPIAFKMRVLG